MVGVRGWYIKRTCCVIIALSTAAIGPDMVIGFVILTRVGPCTSVRATRFIIIIVN